MSTLSTPSVFAVRQIGLILSSSLWHIDQTTMQVGLEVQETDPVGIHPMRSLIVSLTLFSI